MTTTDELIANLSTAERLIRARMEAQRLAVVIASYEERLEAANEHVALLEEKEQREMGAV